MGFTRIGTGCGLAMLLLSFAVPSLASPEAMGIPDAPPVEKIVARHDGFDIPGGFDTPDGRHFPGGTYDLALIERGGRYYLQLTHQSSRRGIRVAARVTRPRADARTRSAADRSLHFGREATSIRLTVGDVATTFPLREPRKAG